MSAQAMQILGSALLHFLWQGVALAALLFLAIWFTCGARLRYGLAVFALALMALCPLATMIILQKPVTVTAAALAKETSLTVAIAHTASRAIFDWPTCFVSVWFAGVSLFSLRALGGWLVLRRLHRSAEATISAAILQRCHNLQRRLGIKKAIRFAESSAVDAPAVLGWFRPIVLLPLASMAGLSVEQLEAVIAHELAHIKRYDALVNLLQIAIETLLFYHPAVWWVSSVIRTEREHCCDDIAVAVRGDAHEYARALSALSGAGKRPAWAMAVNNGSLKERVARLLGLPKMAHSIPRAGWASIAVLCASGGLLAAAAFVQVPPPPPPPPSPVLPAPVPPVSPAPLLAPVAPEAPPPPTSRSSMAAMGFILAEKEFADLNAQIQNMERRYTADYPGLVEAKKRLADLQQEMSAYGLAEEHNASSEQEIRRQVAAMQRQIALAKKQLADAAAVHGVSSAEQEELQRSLDELTRTTKLDLEQLLRDSELAVRQSADAIGHFEALERQIPDSDQLSNKRLLDALTKAAKDSAQQSQTIDPRQAADLRQSLASIGVAQASDEDLYVLREQGVTSEFIAKVRAHGFTDLTLDKLFSLVNADVIH